MKNNTKTIIDTKTIVLTGVLSSLAIVLSFFPKIPGIIPIAPWLDIDFADTPALFASVSVSPVAGVLVVLIKNLLHWLLGSSTGGVGELSNFLCGSALVLSCGIINKLIFKNKLNKIKLPVTLLIAAMCQLIVSVLTNYYLMVPLYGDKLPTDVKTYILSGVVPFNIIKDVLVCVVFYILFVLVYPKIQKRLY